MAVPKFVRDRNRDNSYADQQAQGYARRPRYLLGGPLGVLPIADFPKWLTERSFTPMQRRQIDELRVGEAMNLLDGELRITLYCEPPEEPDEQS